MILRLVWGLLLLSSSMFATNMHPVLTINKKFVPLEQANTVCPYTTSIFALDMLKSTKKETAKLEVKKFILWYVSHTNKLDNYGLSGTIYDYEILLNGQEKSLQSYDSADGYAGMFLYLVREYYSVTKDKELIKTIFPTLKDMAYLIYHLKDSDGLTVALAKKDYDTKFLMDNVESYIGIESYIYLAKVIDTKTMEYTSLKDELKNAILNILYDEKSGLFYWAKDGDVLYKSSQNVFYPDMFAQIHLLAFFGKNISKQKVEDIWYKILSMLDKRSNEDDSAPIKSIFNHIKNIFSDESHKFSMEQFIIFGWARAYILKNQI